MLVFFFTSSMLTKVGQEKKRSVDAEFKEGGQRNWYSSLPSIFLSLLSLTMSLMVWGMTLEASIRKYACVCFQRVCIFKLKKTLTVQLWHFRVHLGSSLMIQTVHL